MIRGDRRAGLADDVRRLLGPRVVDVRIDAPETTGPQARRDHHGRSPQELLREFLQSQGVVDARLEGLFDALLDEALERA